MSAQTAFSHLRWMSLYSTVSSMLLTTLIVALLHSALPSLAAAVTEENCEVCVKYLRKFRTSLPEDVKGNSNEIEEKFKQFCVDSKGKDNRFCYYIGGLPESATYILGEMAKPLSWSMPEEKVCEKLSKLDAQVCELKYEPVIDLQTVDIKKLKVKDLKKILDASGESCDGCLEKSDYVKMVENLRERQREEL